MCYEKLVDDENTAFYSVDRNASMVTVPVGRWTHFKSIVPSRPMGHGNRISGTTLRIHLQLLLSHCFFFQIVGVAQVINKNKGVFSTKDEKVFASYLGFCGIAIHNAQMFEKIQLENRRNEVISLTDAVGWTGFFCSGFWFKRVIF